MVERKSLNVILKDYIKMQADIGISKHMGGFRATNELIKMCKIDKDKYILEVGCGVGRTSCYIAKKYNCKVVGIDISEEMIAKSKERVKKERVEKLAKFIVADVQNLPFKNDTFDVIIGESILALVKDKEKAVKECIRVVKANGYLGFNEVIWLKTPPVKLERYIFNIAGVNPLSANNWRNLLERCGVKNIKVKTYKISAFDQWINEIKLMDPEDFLKSWCKFFLGFIMSSTYRKFARETLSMPENILSIFEYMGYGLFVGKKN